MLDNRIFSGLAGPVATWGWLPLKTDFLNSYLRGRQAFYLELSLIAAQCNITVRCAYCIHFSVQYRGNSLDELVNGFLRVVEGSCRS